MAPLARLSSGDVAWSVTVVHFLLVISSSMWHVGLLPASDEDTCVNIHALEYELSVIDTLIIPFAPFI